MDADAGWICWEGINLDLKGFQIASHIPSFSNRDAVQTTDTKARAPITPVCRNIPYQSFSVKSRYDTSGVSYRKPTRIIVLVKESKKGRVHHI